MPTKGEPVVPHFASGPLNVILVADADLLHDQFWVTCRNCSASAWRCRRRTTRRSSSTRSRTCQVVKRSRRCAGVASTTVPFERVAAIRREAERSYREKEQALNAKLKDLQGKLQQMETRSEGGQILLSDKDRQTIEGFRGEMIGVRRELRGVQADLRRDIDRLDGWLKFFNIAAVPLLIGIGGIARRAVASSPPGAGQRSEGMRP